MATHPIIGGGKLYETFAPKERLVLLLEAMARGDDAETMRLRRSCPRKTYTGPDAAFDDRKLWKVPGADGAADSDDNGGEAESEEEADKAYVQEDLSCLGEDVGRRMQAVEERSEHATELIGLVLSRTGHDLASELTAVWEAFGHFCTSRVGLSAQQVLGACGYPGREQLASWLKAHAHVKPNAQAVAGYREGLCGVWDRRFGEE
jgi:hypothetical protein